MKKVAPKKNKKQTKVTLDSLAGMVANGFTELREEMNTRFDEVDKRFEQVDARIDMVDQKVTALRGEVISMNYEHKKVIARIENLELRTFGSVQE